MSRDYKRSAPRQADKKNGNPMVIGIIIGLFIGLAFSLGVALFITNGPNPFNSVEKPSAKEEAKTDNTAKTKVASVPPLDDGLNKTPDKPRFDFYNILPGNETPVTEQELKQAVQKPAANKDQEQYFLQAGSFPNEADADNLKAKLALIGVEASIQSAAVPDKGMWHRVRIGPITNIDELNRVRSTLSQNSVPTTLVKIKDSPPN
ncbi:MAG: SPOR domain-containing protein [Burkholderiales bacterium]